MPSLVLLCSSYNVLCHIIIQRSKALVYANLEILIFQAIIISFSGHH